MINEENTKEKLNTEATQGRSATPCSVYLVILRIAYEGDSVEAVCFEEVQAILMCNSMNKHYAGHRVEKWEDKSLCGEVVYE